MPWQINGTFLRINTDFSGNNVWQQDQQAAIKIIASRHDTHDEDLALGIAQCVNVNGLNTMLANLDMGGFKIVNQSPGSTDADTALFGQILAHPAAGTFDDPSRELRLLREDGTPYDPIIIPGAGGGGGGTVTQVDSGAGLVGGPINVSGALALDSAPFEPPQTYSGGISSITLNDFGQVTQVVTGGFSNTNLSHTFVTNAIRINSSTGQDTTIGNASASIDGWMTSDSWNIVNNPAAGNPLGITNTQEADDVSVQVTGSSVGATPIGNWYDTVNAGVFMGEVTTNASPSGAGKPDGYVFFVVDP
jgi:hypothetical protein